MFLSCDIADLTLRLVQISSVTKDEKTICDTLLDWVRHQFPASTCPQSAGGSRVRHNFWFSPKLLPGRPTIGLVGHLDTVPPAQVQEYQISDGRVYGLGACDMKGGVAVLLQALALAERSPYNLVAVLYDREEGPYSDNGLDLLLPQLPPLDFALVYEPTCNKIQAGCVGSLHAQLRVKGKRAHSARPWQGENALFNSLAPLEYLSKRGRKEIVIENLPFYEVLTPTQCQTHSATNVVPEEVDFNINYRFAPGKTTEQAWLEIQSELSSFGELTLKESAPAGSVSLDQPILREWVQRCQIATEAKQAWTDVARLTAAGIPAVNFGPGDPAQAHQANEHVEIDALQQGLTLTERLLCP